MATGLRFDGLDFSDAIDRDLVAYMAEARVRVLVNFKLQGHNYTGKYANTLSVEKLGPHHYGLMGQEYGLALNVARPASYFQQRYSNRALYLEDYLAMVKWGMRKARIPRSRAGGFAAAVLRKWMREGSPTAASLRFSRNGKKTGFLDDAIAEAGEPTRFQSFLTTLENIA